VARRRRRHRLGQQQQLPVPGGLVLRERLQSPPVADFCNGKDFDLGVVPGVSAWTEQRPVPEPFYSGALCKGYCTTSAGGEGFSQCLSYKHVVTVWRNFDPATQYKICNKTSARCLEVAGSSTSDGAAVQQRSFSGGSNQKWTIIQIAAGKYKVVNAKSGKALDSKSGKTSDGTAAIQYAYSGATSQQWSFTSLSDQPGFYKLSPVANSNTSICPWGSLYSDGTPIEDWSYNTADYQKWTITPAN